jgi:CBS domain containing-hemolysin-like protein
LTNTTLILITLLLSAFFSGMEIAFISSNKLKIELDRSKGLFGAKILAVLGRNPSRFIGTILLGNNIALVVYGIAMANILDPLLRSGSPLFSQSETLLLLVQTVIATLIILILSEFLPKALFRINPNSLLNFFALPLSIIYYLLYPLVVLFIGASEWVLKNLFKVRVERNGNVFSIVDLDDFLKKFFPEESKKEEDIQQEIQIFQNAMELSNVKIRECMVPRPEIVAVEEKDSMKQLTGAFVENGYSKILIYRENIDQVIGYVHSFDMFSNPQSIRDILRPIPIVPEAMLANKLMTMFIQQHKSVAVVVDEFGGTSGMVTMEDVIEEIFGEIEDEFDDEELVDRKVDENEYLFSARLEIDYINDKYGLNLPVAEEYETLAGLIIHNHESIPATGEQISIPGFEFDILEVTDAKIEQVRLREVING